MDTRLQFRVDAETRAYRLAMGQQTTGWAHAQIKMGDLGRAILSYQRHGDPVGRVRDEVCKCMAQLVRIWEEGDPSLGLPPLLDHDQTRTDPRNVIP